MYVFFKFGVRLHHLMWLPPSIPLSHPLKSQLKKHMTGFRALLDLTSFGGLFFQGTECWFYEETWDDPDADNTYPDRGRNCMW